MKKAWRGIGIGVVGLAWLSACGGSSDSDGDGNSGVSIDEIPALYADAVCDASESCYGAVLDVFLGGESCRKTYETTLGDELPRLKQSIENGKVIYKGTKADACFAAIRARGCNLEGEPPECTAALDGTVDTGGDCELDAECKGSDAHCKVQGQCPGKCGPKELAGADCDGDSDCANGLACSKDTKKCYAPAALGQACGGGGTAPDCVPGAFCLGSDDDAKKTGTCKTFAEAFAGKSGDACFFDGKPACTADLRCIVQSVDTTTGKLTTSCGGTFPSGGACKLAVPDACPISEYCKVPANALDGTCTPRPKAGEPCATLLDDSLCAPDTRCEDGTCRPRQKLGGSCKTDDVCYSGHCQNGGCASAGSCS